MIGFWVLAAILILAALAALLRPLVWRAGRASDQGEPVVAMFRRQLSDIDMEIGQGRLAPDEAAAARTEIIRRMLTVADQEGEQTSPGSANAKELSWRIGAAVGVAGLMPAAALAVYFAVGNPAAINPSAAARTTPTAGPHDMAELAAAVDQLKARLERDSDHPEGWALLGRTLATLGRFTEAQDAFAHAIALAPDEPRLHAELGETLVLAAQGTITPAAEAEFAKSGDDPRAVYYRAEAALQRGDSATAKSALQALLAEIAPGESRTGARPAVGPTEQDVAAAQSMSPEDRQAMIRGMVERLAARLAEKPDDPEGWARLARAYDVLGETEKAQAARQRAEAVAAPKPATPAR